MVKRLFVMKLDSDTDAAAKSNDEAKLNNEETNINKKQPRKNAKLLYFTCIFINYYSIIDSC